MEPIEVQPYAYDEEGKLILAPAFCTTPYEHVGLLVEKSNRSLMILLRNHDQQEAIPSIFLQEKDIVHMMVGLQQAIEALRHLPVENV